MLLIFKRALSSATVLDVRRGDVEKLRKLLSLGADPNWQTKHGPGYHLLDIAARHGDLGIIHLLLEFGADPNRKNNDGSTSVHTAAIVARPTILTALLNAGGQPDGRDQRGATPMHRGIELSISDTSQGSRMISLNRFDDMGAAPDSAAQDLPASITTLINAGCDPNSEMPMVGTPLHLLAKLESTAHDFINALKKHGKIPNSLEYNETPLFKKLRTLIPTVIGTLKQDGADVNRKTTFGGQTSPIFHAAEKGSITTNALLKAGADPNLQSLIGSTPLHMALSCRNLDVVRALLNTGADPNLKTKKRGDVESYITVLEEDFGREEIEKVFSHYAPFVRAEGMQTPLHIAASVNYFDAIEILIQNGASLHEKDEYGRTPFDIAQTLGYTHAAALLQPNSQ